MTLRPPSRVFQHLHMVNRHLILRNGSVQTIKRVVENRDFVDAHVLRSYLDKITKLEGELQGLYISTLEDIGELV